MYGVKVTSEQTNVSCVHVKVMNELYKSHSIIAHFWLKYINIILEEGQQNGNMVGSCWL